MSDVKSIMMLAKVMKSMKFWQGKTDHEILDAAEFLYEQTKKQLKAKKKVNK